jgi:uncharacterized protein (TIGR00255 family)
MIRSMTGYGSAAADNEWVRATVSVRSLNHRFLDVSVHAGRALAALEREIRTLVESRLRRGRVEVSVQAALRGPAAASVAACRPVVAGLVTALREIAAEHGLEGGVALSDVARFPGALEVVDGAMESAHRRQLLELVERAVTAAETMRRDEGGHLAQDLLASLDAIESRAARVLALAEAGRAERRASLAERGRELLLELGLDEARLLPELARLLERNDVAEEVQRLRSHVAQARALVRGEAPAGKKLDFLAQELMREANTVGSKAASAALVHEVVELKGEVERFREQVQNVE